MTCIMEASASHYEIVYFLSYAVCPVPTRLRSYNISGGGHLISPFRPSSSNIFGDVIQLATLPTSSVFFGILLFMVAGGGVFRHLYTTFCLLRNIIKIVPLLIPTTARIGCSWLRQTYYSNEPHYQYQQQHATRFLF